MELHRFYYCDSCGTIYYTVTKEEKKLIEDILNSPNGEIRKKINYIGKLKEEKILNSWDKNGKILVKELNQVGQKKIRAYLSNLYPNVQISFEKENNESFLRDIFGIEIAVHRTLIYMNEYENEICFHMCEKEIINKAIKNYNFELLDKTNEDICVFCGDILNTVSLEGKVNVQFKQGGNI